MQRAAWMSVVVRAEGVSEALYNGQRDRVVEAIRTEASERIRAANIKAEREHRRAEAEEKACNRMRKQHLELLGKHIQPRHGIRDRIENVWVSMWAMGLASVEMAKYAYRVAARCCGVGNQEIRRLVDPYPGRKMHWKTLNRLRMALNLTEEEAREIWEVARSDGKTEN